MRNLFILILMITITACSNSKTVLICGDHVCINKTEAKQYFEENLSLEVKIIDKKGENNFDLVELNLNEENRQKKIVSIKKIVEPKNEIKTLSRNEITKIKSEIKNKKKLKKLSKKNNSNQNIVNKNKDKFEYSRKIHKDVKDICKIIDECSIDEISNYLIKMGKNKRFPDITVRE